MVGDPLRTIDESGTNSRKNNPGSQGARTTATHRAGSARPVAVMIWLGAAVVLAWLLLAGRTDAAMAAAPWLVLAGWFVYVMQWRPFLRTDTHGFEIVNGLRDHRIPFDAVDDIEIRHTVVVRAGDGDTSVGEPRRRPAPSGPDSTTSATSRAGPTASFRATIASAKPRRRQAGMPSLGRGMRPGSRGGLPRREVSARRGTGQRSSRASSPPPGRSCRRLADRNLDPVAGSARGRRKFSATPPPSRDFASGDGCWRLANPALG